MLGLDGLLRRHTPANTLGNTLANTPENTLERTLVYTWADGRTLTGGARFRYDSSMTKRRTPLVIVPVPDPGTPTFWSDRRGQVVQNTDGPLLLSPAGMELFLTVHHVPHVTSMSGDRYTIRELRDPHRTWTQISPGPAIQWQPKRT